MEKYPPKEIHGEKKEGMEDHWQSHERCTFPLLPGPLWLCNGKGHIQERRNPAAAEPEPSYLPASAFHDTYPCGDLCTIGLSHGQPPLHRCLPKKKFNIRSRYGRGRVNKPRWESKIWKSAAISWSHQSCKGFVLRINAFREAITLRRCGSSLQSSTGGGSTSHNTLLWHSRWKRSWPRGALSMLPGAHHGCKVTAMSICHPVARHAQRDSLLRRPSQRWSSPTFHCHPSRRPRGDRYVRYGKYNFPCSGVTT